MNPATESAVRELTRKLLSSTATFHLLHLSTTSLSQHALLREVYAAGHDSADLLAEQALGAGLPVVRRQMDPTAALDELILDIEAVIPSISDASLSNTVQEILSTYRRFRYRLSLS